MRNPSLPIAATALALLMVGAGASSATTFSLSEPFGTVGTLPTPWVATGSVVPEVVVGDAGDTPVNALRLTNSDGDQSGFVLYDQAISITSGIDISFSQAQFGGDGGADGIAFFVKDAADASTVPGGSGGSLGYAVGRVAGLPTPGISGALLGVGLDGYGNFDESNSDGSGCVSGAFVRSLGSNAISLRGPGQGTAGYCLLANSVSLNAVTMAPLTNNYSTRAAGTRVVRVVIDPSTAVAPKVTVFYGTTAATLAKVIEVALPAAFATVSGVKIGFAAGTGGSTDNHDVWGLTTAAAPVAEGAPAAPNADPALAATGSDQTGIVVSGLGALLLLAIGVLTMRRRRKA